MRAKDSLFRFMLFLAWPVIAAALLFIITAMFVAVWPVLLFIRLKLEE